MDIKADLQLQGALERVLSNYEAVIDVTFDRNIEYKELGIDEAIKTEGMGAVAKWSDFMSDYKTDVKNHNSILIAIENLGASAVGGHSISANGVRTGFVILPKSRLEKKTIREKEDLIRHELAHAFNIPHTQGPYLIEGPFDNQATMHNFTLFPYEWQRYEPNLDPSSTNEATGFQVQDEHHINFFYPKEKEDHYNIVFKTDLVGMNLALVNWNKPEKNVAMPSINGEFTFYVDKGKYALYLRRASMKGGKLSSVFSEYKEPSTKKEYWYRYRIGNRLIFKPATKKKHYRKRIKLRKDKHYTILIKD